MSNFTKFTIVLVIIIILGFTAAIVMNNKQQAADDADAAKSNEEHVAEVVKDNQDAADKIAEEAKGTDKEELVSEKGDTVTIDYIGISGGEEFDGGTDSDYDLELGSGSFIDGFEDQLIGHKVGDLVQVEVTFPDDYSSTDLAGKDAVFVTTIKDIKKA
ncbi:MAG: FKBP-type peptidyl-prolyl cis-trans isomerase [Mycoplasmatales bacterium]